MACSVLAHRRDDGFAERGHVRQFVAAFALDQRDRFVPEKLAQIATYNLCLASQGSFERGCVRPLPDCDAQAHPYITDEQLTIGRRHRDVYLLGKARLGEHVPNLAVRT
jgi:hypothetical protein